MSSFAKLRMVFNANWTTVLVGWNGLGVFSPWPERWTEFPPLISPEEIAAYAEEQLTSSGDQKERELVIMLLSSDLRSESREMVKSILESLSYSCGADQVLELRKWRFVLLDEVLESVPNDALYGLTALTGFWQSFGFPTDSPHEVQGRGNTVSPSEYYQPETLRRLIEDHHAWVQNERTAIRRREG